MSNYPTPFVREEAERIAARLDELRPLVAEHAQLDEALTALERAATDADAPYGRKRDGTPKAKPGRRS